MQKSRILKIAQRIGYFLLPVLLCLLFGCWLLVDFPAEALSVLAAAFFLFLLILFYLNTVAVTRRYSDSRLRAPAISRERHIGTREIVRLMGILLAVRFLVLLLAYTWHLAINGYTETLPEYLHIWADHPLSARYVSLANHGYRWKSAGTGDVYANLVVAPLYALLVRLCSPSAEATIKVAFLLSNVNIIFSGIALYALTARQYDRRTARLALGFFSLLPASFLWTCTLADSTFMLFSVLTFYALYEKKYVLSSVFAFLAVLTEVQGIALFFALSAALVCRYSRIRREKIRLKPEANGKQHLLRQGAGLLLVPLGYVLYLLINRIVSGYAWTFADLSGGFRIIFSQLAALTDNCIACLRNSEMKELFGMYLPAAGAFFGSITVLIAGKKHLPIEMCIYSLFYFLCVPNASGAWPRLLSTCFPVILACAGMASQKKWLPLLLLLFLGILLLLRLGMFANGWPAE